jgi:hypothetical protein
MAWLYTLLVSAALSFAGGFGIAWHVKNNEIESIRGLHAAELLDAERVAHQIDMAHKNALIDAQSKASQRDIVLRGVVDNLRGSVAGLRDSLALRVGDGSTSPANSCAYTSYTVASLLNQCAARYSDLAEKCDRHVNDIKTLTDAWPK